ncbi:hypothetical protein PAMC26510_23455 [Caballeronia sordidicola]|uniref:Uncharacterized protein n=1 Tax=Caballeronia sordidicola TaxID=196367 RepID=A0A242MJ81_CABSO|nr:hypothetical protein PAMC26510_23455 [Caballeronia sordidicola]
MQFFANAGWRFKASAANNAACGKSVDVSFYGITQGGQQKIVWKPK